MWDKIRQIFSAKDHVTRLSGFLNQSFWPAVAFLKTMLTQDGYKKVHVIEDDAKHPHGPEVTLAAMA